MPTAPWNPPDHNLLEISRDLRKIGGCKAKYFNPVCFKVFSICLCMSAYITSVRFIYSHPYYIPTKWKKICPWPSHILSSWIFVSYLRHLLVDTWRLTKPQFFSIDLKLSSHLFYGLFLMAEK